MAAALPRNSALRTRDPAHPDFTTSQAPFYWLNRVVHGHAREMEVALKRVGLDVPEWRILTTLTELEPASVSLLAEHCATKLSTMTKAIGRLESQGLVKTRTGEADARVTEVLLTAKGRKIVPLAREKASRVFQQTLAGIDDHELNHFVATLQHMLKNIYEFHT
jgi:DNA-binding MarR family transcriptional regulator